MRILDAIETISEEELKIRACYYFKLVVFSWILLSNLMLFPYRFEIYSDSSFIAPYPNIADDTWYSTLVFKSIFNGKQIYFYYAQTIGLVLGILNFWPRLINLVILVLTANVWNKAWVTMDGGNNLISILMIYMLFLNTSGKPIKIEKKWLQSVRIFATVFHNTALLASLVQVAVVYFTAGYLKANGNLWQNGMALYYILQSDTYGSPMAATIMKKYPDLSVIGSYFAQIFQLTFPTLVWFRQTKHYILLAGVLLHLGIALSMGLFFFGLAMVSSYVLFLDESTFLKFNLMKEKA